MGPRWRVGRRGCGLWMPVLPWLRLRPAPAARRLLCCRPRRERIDAMDRHPLPRHWPTLLTLLLLSLSACNAGGQARGAPAPTSVGAAGPLLVLTDERLSDGRSQVEAEQ